MNNQFKKGDTVFFRKNKSIFSGLESEELSYGCDELEFWDREVVSGVVDENNFGGIKNFLSVHSDKFGFEIILRKNSFKSKRDLFTQEHCLLRLGLSKVQYEFLKNEGVKYD